jgi:hypothetical protein
MRPAHRTGTPVLSALREQSTLTRHYTISALRVPSGGAESRIGGTNRLEARAIHIKSRNTRKTRAAFLNPKLRTWWRRLQWRLRHGHRLYAAEGYSRGVFHRQKPHWYIFVVSRHLIDNGGIQTAAGGVNWRSFTTRKLLSPSHTARSPAN